MRRIVIIYLCMLLIAGVFTSCQSTNVYVPAGEFYIKTAPSRGDTGVSEVISIEAEYKRYHGEGDITVPMTVGFGHLPGLSEYGDDVQVTFYALYKVTELPWRAEKESVWEKKVEYSDSWYDAKYDSTEQKNPPTFIFARYGEFYPIYKEMVEIVFPAEVARGRMTVELHLVIEGQAEYQFSELGFYFERKDGALWLKSSD